MEIRFSSCRLDLAGSGNRSGFPGPLSPAGTRQEYEKASKEKNEYIEFVMCNKLGSMRVGTDHRDLLILLVVDKADAKRF